MVSPWSWLRRQTGRPDRADFDREVLPHLDALYGTALRLTRNQRDAEDLVQDTALRAFRFFHRFEAGTNARAWLFKILHNTFATRYRRGSRERELLDAIDESSPADAPVPAAPPDPEQTALARSFSDEVQRALDRLPEEFRVAVTLCDLEELSYREIAEVLDIPVGTVMSRLHRGRRLLQEALRGYAASAGVLRPEAVNMRDPRELREARKSSGAGAAGADVIPLPLGPRRSAKGPAGSEP